MSLFEIPLHSSLVHYPIALLLLGGIVATIDLWRPISWLKKWGLVSLAAGWILTLPAVVTGLVDKSGIEADTAADRLANLHTTTMLAMWALYGVVLYLLYIWRDDLNESRRKWSLTALLLLASAILLLASHYGGRLVYEQGVGIQ